MTNKRKIQKTAKDLKLGDKLYALHYGEYSITQDITVYSITKLIASLNEKGVDIWGKVFGSEKHIITMLKDKTQDPCGNSVYFINKEDADLIYKTIQNLHNKRIDEQVKELKSLQKDIFKTPKIKFIEP